MDRNNAPLNAVRVFAARKPLPHRRIEPRGKLNAAYASGVAATLRLDSVWVAEYVGLHGVGASIHDCWRRESHNLWLGLPLGGKQATLTPENKHRRWPNHEPYWLAAKHVMGICCAYIRLSDRNIEAMIRQPSLVYSLLGLPVESPRPSGSFFARLFGRTPPPSPPAEPATLPDSREEGDEGDVDKAWQGIHYLLTGTAEPTDSPLGFLYSGGTTIEDTDVGYGPPRAYTSAQIASIATELSALDRGSLHRRYKPKEMDEQDVYPQIWARDGEEGFEYAWQHFEGLRSLLAEAHRRKQGLLVYHC